MVFGWPKQLLLKKKLTNKNYKMSCFYIGEGEENAPGMSSKQIDLPIGVYVNEVNLKDAPYDGLQYGYIISHSKNSSDLIAIK